MSATIILSPAAAAEALHHGHHPDDGLIVHHVDGDRKNNRMANLELIRPSTNVSLGWVGRRRQIEKPGTQI